MTERTIVHLMRHGEVHNPTGVLYGRIAGYHLSELGRQMADRVAEHLASRDVTYVCASPLERAQETAAPLAERLGLPVETVAELGELRYGRWTGRTLAELDDDPLWRQYNTFRSGTRIPDGELMLETQARAVGALVRLREARPAAVHVIVSHGDVLRAILAHYAGIPLDHAHRLEISPASVSTLVLEDWGPKITGVNAGAEG